LRCHSNLGLFVHKLSNNVWHHHHCWIVHRQIRIIRCCLPLDSARNLGVIIDSQLSLNAHVAAVCRSGYYQLRQLRPVTGSLSADAAKTLVQAFISSRLDYCNVLLYGVSDGMMRRLQSVQNAAARLVTGARRRDHITPILYDSSTGCRRVNE